MHSPVGKGLQHSSGRVITLGRLMLATLYLIAVWLETELPFHTPPVTYGILIGYIVFAAALAVATWITRGSPQGGIYGRPIVLANTWVYTITALVCLRAFWVSTAVSVVALVAAAFAALYAYVLFRGQAGPVR